MTRLLLATNNPGKLVEIQAVLNDLSAGPGLLYSLVLPSMLGIHLEVEENGKNYAENAALKARTFCQASGLLTLADDSGLEVGALGGAPGLHSARYHPQEGASDADRRAYLLEQLASKPRPWLARFTCTIAIITPTQELYFAHGDCPGEIIPEERGQNGFGYDPIFYLAAYGQTMAELPSEEKNKISHRASALRAALPVLQELAHKNYR